MFHPNDKVVCINGDFRFSVFGIPLNRFRNPHGVPQEGQVYTVRAVIAGEAGTQGLLLVGLSTFLHGRETGFNSTRFRKVDRGKGVGSESEQAAEPAAATSSPNAAARPAPEQDGPA